MTLNLPVPTPSEVEEFRRLYKEHVGADLSDRDAWFVSTNMLQLFYLSLYGAERAPRDAGASPTPPEHRPPSPPTPSSGT